MLEITQSTRRPFGMNDSWLKCYDKRKERRTIVGPYIGSIIEYHNSCAVLFITLIGIGGHLDFEDGCLKPIVMKLRRN